MTTAIIHGDPGSRKTATLVSEYGIPALYEGRVVVSNIRGFNDLEHIEQIYGKSLPASAELISIPFTESGFEKMARFFHWVPVGALILMDEGQRVYPTRIKSLSVFDCDPSRETGFKDEKTQEPEVIRTVESAFDCHRHMNWDIYISTPNIGKIHKEIRQVAEFGYRQKDLSAVLPALSIFLGDFKRVKHDAEKSGKSQSDAIQMSNHRIDKRAFECYQSTATGAVKGSHTKASLLHSPKLLLLILLLGFVVVKFGYNLVHYGAVFPSSAQIIAANNDNAPGAGSPVPMADNPANQAGAKARVLQGDSTVVSAASRDDHFGFNTQVVALELFNKLYSWNGYIQTHGSHYYLLTLFDGEQYSSINSRDLFGMGFEVIPRFNYVIISYGGLSKILFANRYQAYDSAFVYQEQKPTQEQQTNDPDSFTM